MPITAKVISLCKLGNFSGWQGTIFEDPVSLIGEDEILAATSLEDMFEVAKSIFQES